MNYNISDETARDIRAKVILQAIADLHSVMFHSEAVEDIENGGLDIWMEEFPFKIKKSDILKNYEAYYKQMPAQAWV
jgi:hypothetical protein